MRQPGYCQEVVRAPGLTFTLRWSEIAVCSGKDSPANSSPSPKDALDLVATHAEAHTGPGVTHPPSERTRTPAPFPPPSHAALGTCRHAPEVVAVVVQDFRLQGLGKPPIQHVLSHLRKHGEGAVRHWGKSPIPTTRQLGTYQESIPHRPRGISAPRCVSHHLYPVSTV
jgi:hypothetical protein